MEYYIYTLSKSQSNFRTLSGGENTIYIHTRNAQAAVELNLALGSLYGFKYKKVKTIIMQ